VGVSLLEVNERVVTAEESEASDPVPRVLERDGVEVRTGMRLRF
jgi:NADH dehydrogenase FAD-containing subunit